MATLVAGGAGFIGSHFVEYLLQETKESVITLDALTYAGDEKNLDFASDNPRHRFVEGDIRDQALVSNILIDVEQVVNFAAESHVDRSIDSAEPFVSTNVEGTRSLLNASRTEGVGRFVQISTDEVYGEIERGSFSESDPLDPSNPYAATKAGADLLALSFHTTYDLPVSIIRSSNNFGPRQHPEKLIPKLIRRAATGKTLPIYGDGRNVREWTYVKDNCRAIGLAMEKGNPGEVYNIGSGEEMSNIDVAETILDALGASQELIEFVEDRPGHDRRYALDSSKIRHLGWEPSWSFDAGLEETMDTILP